MLQFEEQKIRLSGLDKDIKDLGDGAFAISQRTADIETAKNVISHLS